MADYDPYELIEAAEPTGIVELPSIETGCLACQWRASHFNNVAKSLSGSTGLAT
jgi:peroxiredoxin